MTRVIEPVCGFAWGYDIRDAVPSPTRLLPVETCDWHDVREELRVRLPSWTFGGDEWAAPAFDP